MVQELVQEDNPSRCLGEVASPEEQGWVPMGSLCHFLEVFEFEVVEGEEEVV